jgi:hypothetical protein
MPDATDIGGRDVVGAEVDAVGSYGQGNIRAGVDEENRFPFPVLSSEFRSPQDSHGFSCERFEVPSRQIFFAKLEEIDAGTRGFRNLAEKLSALGGFISRELAAIRDVAKKRRTRHKSFQPTTRADSNEGASS